jgi:hypothetical protein
MWTTPFLAALALAQQPAEVAPVPAPAPAAAPAPQPYGAPPPNGYQQQPPPPGYQQQPYGYPPPGYSYPPPPPQAYEPPPPPPRRTRGKGMMIAGWSIFGGTWITSIAIGAAFLDTDTPSGYYYGRRLMIPVLGPFLAAGGDDSASGTMAYAFLGLAQTAGLALGIAGTVLFARDRKSQRVTASGLHLGRGVYLRSSPRWGGGTLSLGMRF